METADVAALSGRHAGHAIARWLTDRSGAAVRAGVPIEVAGPLAWTSPQHVRSTAELPPRGKVILRPKVFATLPTVRVRQGDRTLWSGRLPRFVPNRPTLLPASWLARVDLNGPAVRIEVATASRPG